MKYIFLFLVFLVSCFLVHDGGLLKGVFASSPTLVVCKLAFGSFYYLLWACGSISKQCKQLWQNAGATGHVISQKLC